MNKYKKLAANTFIFSLGSFSSKILSVLLLKLYTAYMTTADYSVATKIQNIINLLGPVVTLSLSESILRYGLKKEYSHKKVYSTAVSLGVMGLAVGMIILLLVATAMGYRSYLTLMMLFLFTSEFRWMQQQHVKAKNYLKLYTVDSILSVFSLLIFSLLFMVVFKLSVSGYILAIVLSDLLSIIFLIYFARIREDFSLDEQDDELRDKMVRYSVPLIPTSILWWIVSSADLFMVSKFLGDDINGLYSCAYRIPGLISFASVIFFRAWQMSAINEFGTPECRAYYTKVFDAYTSMMFVGSAGIMFLLQPLTKLLAAEKFWDSYKLAPFLVTASLMQSFCNFLSGIYNASGSNKKSLTTSAAAATVNLALNLILIPVVKVQGAAFATMAAYFVCFVIRLKDTREIAQYTVNSSKLIANVFLLMLMTILILTDAAFMHLWLCILFLVVCLINSASLIQTGKMLVKR